MTRSGKNRHKANFHQLNRSSEPDPVGPDAPEAPAVQSAPAQSAPARHLVGPGSGSFSATVTNQSDEVIYRITGEASLGLALGSGLAINNPIYESTRLEPGPDQSETLESETSEVESDDPNDPDYED